MEFTAKQLLDELINKIEKSQQHVGDDSSLHSNTLLNNNSIINPNNLLNNNLLNNGVKLGKEWDKELDDTNLFDFSLNLPCKQHTNTYNTDGNTIKSINDSISNILLNKCKLLSQTTVNSVNTGNTIGNRKKRIVVRGYEKVVKNVPGMLKVKKDVCNLLFSHFPKYLNSCFRFKVGELCYLKWYDELCLVIINFASQKLLISTDNDFDDNYDNYDQERSTQDRRNVWLYDINEEVFLDHDNHSLYSKLNELKPINILLDNNFTYNFTHNFKDFKDKHSLRYYFVPMYYVTFPGYKRRCSKLFRFWVQEKDLIKFKSIKFISNITTKDIKPVKPIKDAKDIKDVKDVKSKETNVKNKVNKSNNSVNKNKDKNMKEVKKELKKELSKKDKKEKKVEVMNNCSYVIMRTRGDKLWNKRKILPINEYVYDVIHNLYHHDLVSGRYITNNEFFCNNGYVPWMVPKAVRKVVIRHHRLITTNKISIRQTIKYRKSIHLIIQNFKFLLLLISKLTNPHIQQYNNTITNTNRVNSGNSVSGSGSGGDGVECLDQLGVVSLYIINNLEMNGNMSKFNEIYINNLYWLDVLLLWIDHFFLNNCCYTLSEYNQLQHLTKLYNHTLTQLLNYEYLCRVLTFDMFYKNFLSRIQKNNKHFANYLPVIQLLLYYLAFIADDYTNHSLYGIKTPQ